MFVVERAPWVTLSLGASDCRASALGHTLSEARAIVERAPWVTLSLRRERLDSGPELGFL